MKKLTAFLLICCLLVSLGFAIPSAQAAGSSETAKKAVRNMVIGWNVVSKAKSIGAVCFIWDNGNSA